MYPYRTLAQHYRTIPNSLHLVLTPSHLSRLCHHSVLHLTPGVQRPQLDRHRMGVQIPTISLTPVNHPPLPLTSPFPKYILLLNPLLSRAPFLHVLLFSLVHHLFLVVYVRRNDLLLRHIQLPAPYLNNLVALCPVPLHLRHPHTWYSTILR